MGGSLGQKAVVEAVLNPGSFSCSIKSLERSVTITMESVPEREDLTYTPMEKSIKGT